MKTKAETENKKDGHNGHRERMFKRLKEQGFNSFSESEKLEMLLYCVIPRKDTRPTAEALIDRYKNIYRVFSAPESELLGFPLITERAVSMFSVFKSTSALLRVECKMEESYAQADEEVADYMQVYFADSKCESTELLIMVSLNDQGRFLGCDIIGDGDLSTVTLNGRLMAEVAIKRGATKAMLGHNHPSGVAQASDDDIAATKKASEILKGIGVELCDHIVFAECNRYYMSEDNRCKGFFTGTIDAT